MKDEIGGDLAELRLHLRDEYMLSKIVFVVPGISFPTRPTQHKDTSTSTSSNEIAPEITPETRDFSLDGDENSLIFIAGGCMQPSVSNQGWMTFTLAFRTNHTTAIVQFLRCIHGQIDGEDRHEIT
jgi:hypothetical protein